MRNAAGEVGKQIREYRRGEIILKSSQLSYTHNLNSTNTCTDSEPLSRVGKHSGKGWRRGTRASIRYRPPDSQFSFRFIPKTMVYRARPSECWCAAGRRYTGRSSDVCDDWAGADLAAVVGTGIPTRPVHQGRSDGGCLSARWRGLWLLCVEIFISNKPG